jgi:hypothetical protein
MEGGGFWMIPVGTRIRFRDDDNSELVCTGRVLEDFGNGWLEIEQDDLPDDTPWIHQSLVIEATGAEEAMEPAIARKPACSETSLAPNRKQA